MKNVDDAIDFLDKNFSEKKRWHSKRQLVLFHKVVLFSLIYSSDKY
jgi:hypothetical protein